MTRDKLRGSALLQAPTPNQLHCCMPAAPRALARWAQSPIWAAWLG